MIPDVARSPFADDLKAKAAGMVVFRPGVHPGARLEVRVLGLEMAEAARYSTTGPSPWARNRSSTDIEPLLAAGVQRRYRRDCHKPDEQPDEITQDGCMLADLE